ncbi:MAG TPA: alpha/beta fold hydrolase [Burkholderiales bacterium]|nr:alpha/beta fold hydrolase [Burkholderiales bacterium]
MDARAIFVCAHGAGGHKDDRGMLALAKALGDAGFEVVRFNFPYRDRGSKLPDPMPVLKESIAAAAAHARNGKKLIIGGRSMGGRAASMLAADGFECDGLVLLAYPLHPAGKPEKLRHAHLAQIRVPVLCFNGTRDALCQRELMEQALRRLSWRMHWLEGADHSFRVLKSSGKRDDNVLRELADVARDWLMHLA